MTVEELRDELNKLVEVGQGHYDVIVSWESASTIDVIDEEEEVYLI